MGDLIAIGIIAVIVVLAVVYIIREKKSGSKCIGCSSGKKCGSNSKKTDTGCGCNHEN